MRKYKGNPKDEWTDLKCWAKGWGAILGLTAKNPIKIGTALFKYPWIFDLLKCNAIAQRMNEGINGSALEMIDYTCSEMIWAVVMQLRNLLTDPENTVITQGLIPTEVYHAMGLKVFIPEFVFSAALPKVDTHAAHPYFDFLTNLGLPADTCSFPRIPLGVILAGHCPPARCIVTSNLPCDGGQSAYYSLHEKMDIPMYTIDIPYDFHSEDGINKIKADLYDLIDFLEKNTGHKMDWDEFKRVCERYNRVNELEIENREMIRTPNPPGGNFAHCLNQTLWGSMLVGTKKSVEVMENFNAMLKKAYAKNEPASKYMRYRAVLWNTSTVCYPHWFNWLERCWGIVVLADMINYGLEDFIDTTTNDSLMTSLAHIYGCAQMSRHNRGPSENYMDGFRNMPQEYNADLILLSNHIGCRNSIAMSGMIQEELRRLKIPMCVIDYELSDIRICSRQGIRDQINNFMRNIMHAEPLDESLLYIDDIDSW